MTVFIICAMFDTKKLYVVGQGTRIFSSRDKAKEYFDSMEQDWTATHYEIHEIKVI